jgi:hypothetical protein
VIFVHDFEEEELVQEEEPA